MAVELVDTDSGEVLDFDDSEGPIVLDDELVCHLAVSASAKVLFSERFDTDYLEDEENVAKQVLEYTFNYIRSHSKAPGRDELAFRFKRIDFASPRSDVNWLIDQFRMRWVRNEAADVVEEVAHGIGKADPRPAIDKAARALQQLRERTRAQNTILTNEDATWVLDAHFQRIEDMGGASGVPFGFPLINAKLLGLKKGQLVFVIGRPKRFKSWMLLRSAVEAQMAGYKVVFYTLEMPLDETFGRYVCMVTGIPYPDFMRGDLTPKELAHVYEKMEEVTEGLIPIQFLQPPIGERHVNDLTILAKEAEADVVYIDQLKFIESDLKVAADKRFATIEKICEELKASANEFPIYVACQFNRQAASLTEMADLSMIGLSDSIGQTADILLGLYQSKTMRQSHELQFGVIDARAFEPTIWTIQEELGIHSNFRCTGVVSDD